MTMLLAASLTVLATGTLPTPAAPAANPFQAYARCSAQCAAASDAGSAPCQTWDWDPTTGKCHLSSTGDPRVGEAAGSAESSDVAAPTSSSPPPSLQKLIAKYAALRNASCGKVLPHVPSLDPGDAAVFMAAYGNSLDITSVHLDLALVLTCHVVGPPRGRAVLSLRQPPHHFGPS